MISIKSESSTVDWFYKTSIKFEDTGNTVHTLSSDRYLVDIKVDGAGAILSAYVCPKEYCTVLSLGVVLAGVPSKVSLKINSSYGGVDEVGKAFSDSITLLNDITNLIEYLGAIS